MKVIAKNTAYLTLAHLVGYVIPLLEIPILARALGPASYGQLVFVQSMALLFSVIVEYGFNLSSSRNVAKEVHNKYKLGQIYSDVFSAKIILTILLVGISLIFYTVNRSIFLGISYQQIVWGALYFLAFAFSPFWFFLGTEKVGGIIALELALRLSCLLLLGFYIDAPSDLGLALALMASTSLLNTVITNYICLRRINGFKIGIKNSLQTLKNGFNVFVYRSSNTVLVTAAPALIGAIADRTAVGIFVPAEKIIRGVVGLATPVFTAAFPHFSRVLSKSESKSIGVAWAVVTVAAVLGVACAVFLHFWGPYLIYWALGAEYGATTELLRWFVWLIPLRIVNQALGLVILIPSGKERYTSLAMVFFSLLSLLIGAMLLQEMKALGMVLALLISEAGLAFVLLFIAAQKSASANIELKS